MDYITISQSNMSLLTSHIEQHGTGNRQNVGRVWRHIITVWREWQFW